MNKITMSLLALLLILGIGFYVFNSNIDDLGPALKNNATIIDVRTVEEFNSGHLAGAINMPLDKIATDYKKLDPNKSYITYCAAGVRSRKGCKQLKSLGLKHVYNGGTQAKIEAAMNTVK